jgi:hypothetical protein
LDFHRTIARIFAGFTWRQIGIWLFCVAIFFLLLNSLLSTQANASSIFWPMTKEKGDPRAFYDPPPPTGKTFRIVWITGSSAQVIGSRITRRMTAPTTPTGELFCKFVVGSALGASLSAVNDKPVEVFQYVIIRGRTLDYLSALEHGIEKVQPDLILFGVNMFNTYVDGSALGERNWHSQMLRWGGGNKDEIGYMLRLMRPQDLEFNVTRSIFSASDQRYDLGRKLKRTISLFPGKRGREVDCARKRQQAGIVGKRALNMAAVRRAVLDRNAPDVNSLSGRLLEKTLSLPGSHGIPAIFYIDPINPALKKDPEVWATLQTRIQTFHIQTARLDRATTALDTSELYRSPRIFLDHSHLNNGDDLVLTLLSAIEGMPNIAPTIATGVRDLMRKRAGPDIAGLYLNKSR